ncbi:hypothetical protein EVAR_83106_1 [Eumeta japonica]|uniref:Retrovirus-related Pol polyprotein from transposon TNT 1-94 n=1 Tax=Eumeta variegata TaxID=151549 RepID=A0A4C1WQ62_EUMVA|nr:hypothetical protein EVAR_83106_1 [Eumeta japonica]
MGTGKGRAVAALRRLPCRYISRRPRVAITCQVMALKFCRIRPRCCRQYLYNQKSIDARNAWIKTDRKAKSEVILAISSTELQHVRGCNTSREMSEGGDVRDHVNKFSDIVDRLGAMDIQVNKDLLSIMLLFSLPDSYEDLRSNLVSVAKITNKDCEVLFRKDSAMIMDSTGNIKFVAERRGDLYYLQEGNEEADIVEDKTNSEF